MGCPKMPLLSVSSLSVCGSISTPCHVWGQLWCTAGLNWSFHPSLIPTTFNQTHNLLAFYVCCQSSSFGSLCMSISAGVGRSGTFVSLLWLLQLCARGIKPDVRATVEDLRKHRVLMVQTLVSASPPTMHCGRYTETISKVK